MKSLTGRLWLMMLLIAIFTGLSFGITTVIINNKAQTDYEVRESETQINGIIGSINGSIDNYKDISRLIMINDQVVKFLKATSADKGIINDTKRGIWDVINVCRYVDSVQIIRNDGAFANTGKGDYDINIANMREETWLNEIVARNGGAIFGMNGKNTVYKQNGSPIFSILRVINDINSQKQTGILVMNISTLMFDSVLSGQEISNVCILDKDGHYLAGNETLGTYYEKVPKVGDICHRKQRINGKKMMVSSYEFVDMPLVIMCETEATIAAFPNETMIILTFLLIAFLLELLLASHFVSRNVTQPITELAEGMELTKERGWMESINVDMPHNEIGMLADSYNSLIDYLKDLFTRLIDKEKSVQKAEMRVLQEQIKPHFLYNSLETISFMAMDSGAEDVHNALETLGSFYRNFLSKGDREIPLEREINIIKDYLKLQKLRYGEVLLDEYDISEDTLGCMIPKLILQPLVENSIYHGIRLKGEPGNIKISSYLEENKLHIIVRDTGVGMSQEMIDLILKPSEEEYHEAELGNHSHFGLKGTIDRVRYFTNNDDVVQIRSEEGEYTEIEFIIAQNKSIRGSVDNV